MPKTDQHKVRIAVFDIDETLLLGTSAEIQLIRFLYKLRIIKIRNILKSLINTLISVFQGINQVIYRKSGYLEGIEKKIILSQLSQLFNQYIWPRVSRKLLYELEKLKKENYEIIIISGTLDFLLDFFLFSRGRIY